MQTERENHACSLIFQDQLLEAQNEPFLVQEPYEE